MSLPFIETVKGMITDPGETIRRSRSASLGDAIIYYLILILIFSVLSTTITWLLGDAHPMPLSPAGDIALAATYLVGIIIGGTIALLIIGAILHICIKIFGGSGDYTDTVRAFSLAETPAAAIGWIPLIGLFAGIWGFILMVMGVSEYHGISTLRAVVAILLPFILLIILAVLAFMFFMVVPESVTVTEVF